MYALASVNYADVRSDACVTKVLEAVEALLACTSHDAGRDDVQLLFSVAEAVSTHRKLLKCIRRTGALSATVTELLDRCASTDETVEDKVLFNQMELVRSRLARPVWASAKSEAADGPPMSMPALKLKIKLKAYDHPELEEACSMIQSAVNDTGATLSGPVPLPTRRRIYCVLRSPHVNSNSREHFETRTHQRMMHVKNVTREAVQSLMNLTLPAGVDCMVRM
jgi:small subunit ribosomal protein S10